MNDHSSNAWRSTLVEAGIVLGWTAVGTWAGYRSGSVYAAMLGFWSYTATTVTGIVAGGVVGFLHVAVRRWPRVQRERRAAEVRRHEAMQDAIDLAVTDGLPSTNRSDVVGSLRLPAVGLLENALGTVAVDDR